MRPTTLEETRVKRQITAMLVAFAVAMTLGACASPNPARSTANFPRTVSVPAGYVLVVSNGQEFFCRHEIETATRMLRESCLTPAQFEEQHDFHHGSALISTPAGTNFANLLSVSSGLR